MNIILFRISHQVKTICLHNHYRNPVLFISLKILKERCSIYYQLD